MTSSYDATYVQKLIDQQRVGGFSLNLIFWSFLQLMIDGYDLSVLSFAAPSLVKDWQLSNLAVLGPLFSAGLVGMLLGSLIGGYIGDRFGRKQATIIGTTIFALFTLACAAATSVQVLMALRLFVGIGLGWVLPNVLALNTEYAPRRLRMTLVVLANVGSTAGGAITGLIAAHLLPNYGWHSLFYVGGFLPLLLVPCLYFFYPESLKFLVARGNRSSEVAALLQKIESNQRPINVQENKDLPADTFAASSLFQGRYKVVTPLLWLMFIVNSMVLYFVLSWMPIISNSAGLSPAQAAVATSMFLFGGAVGGIVLARAMDRFGFSALTLLFAVAVPVIASLGYVTTSEMLLLIVSFVAGMCIFGILFGLNALSGTLYVTSFRSTGIGWAVGLGRFGSIAGPLIGGALVGMKLPVHQLYLVAALPIAVGALGCVAMVWSLAGARRNALGAGAVSS
jgi:AAHS family 4-hydroxybenzoate transporter-like MFS transporter